MKKLLNKELIIGLSVIVAIAILIFGIDYLKGINMLSPTNYYYVNCENVSGLEVSAPVSINGYKVGQVRELTYDFEHPGKIKVLLAVDKQLRIPDDSYAELSSTLMGGGFIDIKMGRSSKYLEIGSDIRTEQASDLMQTLSADIMPTVTAIIPKIDSLITNLNRLTADPALSKSIGRLDGITANILGMTQGLNGTVQRDIPAVMHSARGITTKADSICYNLMLLSRELKQLPLNTTMDNINQVSANLADFSKQLNDQNSTLGKLTTDAELYNKLNRVSADIDSLIVDIKKNPKRYISIKLL